MRRSIIGVTAFLLFLAPDVYGVTSNAAQHVAIDAVEQLYVRPLELGDVTFAVRTEAFVLGETPTRFWIDVNQSDACGRPQAEEPLLTVYSYVVRGRIVGVTASGRLVDDHEALTQEARDRRIVAVIDALSVLTGWKTPTEPQEFRNGERLRVTYAGPTGIDSTRYSASFVAANGVLLVAGVP